MLVSGESRGSWGWRCVSGWAPRAQLEVMTLTKGRSPCPSTTWEALSTNDTAGSALLTPSPTPRTCHEVDLVAMFLHNVVPLSKASAPPGNRASSTLPPSFTLRAGQWLWKRLLDSSLKPWARRGELQDSSLGPVPSQSRDDQFPKAVYCPGSAIQSPGRRCASLGGIHEGLVFTVL